MIEQELGALIITTTHGIADFIRVSREGWSDEDAEREEPSE